jgi:phosphoadenosine phosphosulfate reductase
MAAQAIRAPLVLDLSLRYRDLDGFELLCAVIDRDFFGRVVVVSSFGAESAVLLDLVAQIDPATPVIFLDSGKHFPETRAYRDRLVDHLGLSEVRSVRPDPGDLAGQDPDGRLWQSDPDRCCDLRKVRPLQEALAGFDAWITGRKQHQGGDRTKLPIVAPDRRSGRWPDQGQPAGALEPRTSPRGLPRPRPAVPSLGRRGLSVDRLRALHPPHGTGRGPARRPLGALRQDRMRHPPGRLGPDLIPLV